jgi:hypothetical protein
VRHNDSVGLLLQAGLHGGLVLKHIQAAAELWVGLQMSHQRRLVDAGPARRVDEHRVLLHHRQTLLVDEVVRAGVQVAVQADHLQSAQAGRQRG